RAGDEKHAADGRASDAAAGGAQPRRNHPGRNLMAARRRNRRASAAWLILALVICALGAQMCSANDAAVSPLDAAPVGVLTVPAGQSLLIRYPNLKRVAAGDGAVIDI